MTDANQQAFFDFLCIREFEGNKYVALEKYEETVKECSEKEYIIDELKEELRVIQESICELPNEPIKVAEMLICATKRRTNCMTEKEYDKPIFEKWQLEQIARHLLVYCGSMVKSNE